MGVVSQNSAVLWYKVGQSRGSIPYHYGTLSAHGFYHRTSSGSLVARCCSYSSYRYSQYREGFPVDIRCGFSKRRLIPKSATLLTVASQSHDSKLPVLAWTTIFTICTRTVWTYPQEWQAGITVIAALVALYRIATTFPQSSFGKWVTLILGLLPLWAFGSQDNLISQMTGWAQIPPSPQSTSWSNSHHPIYILAEEAKARFEDIQLHQSRSLQNAVAEYKKRYGRNPPPGFDDWYQFAIDNDVQLVDEFDYLTKSLDSFWQVSPKTLREYVHQALSIDGVNLNTLEIKNHKASLSTGSFQHAQLLELLKPVVSTFPARHLLFKLVYPPDPKHCIPFSRFNWT